MKIIFLCCLASLLSFGQPCPQKIKYIDGNYLKNGDYFYYPNNQSLIRGGNIYYPNGNFLKFNRKVYYPNGQFIQTSINKLYYPNGDILKSDINYYYNNGQHLKWNTNFYYKDGNIARRAGKLYRPDGTETVFPITLQENIENYGTIYAKVESNSEWIDIYFNKKFIDTPLVKGYLDWDGYNFNEYRFILNTGVSNESIYVTVIDNDVTCELVYIEPQEEFFSIYSPVADLNVKVKPGYDHTIVREALMQTLKKLEY